MAYQKPQAVPSPFATPVKKGGKNTVSRPSSKPSKPSKSSQAD